MINSAFMNRLLLVLLMLFCVGKTGLGQDRGYEIKGVVYDKVTKRPIGNVSVSLVGATDIGTLTDLEGRYELTGIEPPFTLRFSHVAYETIEVTVSKKVVTSLDILLTTRINLLPEISVSARKKIDTVFHKPVNVVDYDFIGDQLILLAYTNAFEKYGLFLLNEKEEIIARLLLTGYRPSQFFKSCLGALYVLTELGAYEIHLDKTSLSLKEKIPFEEYETLLKPCILATDSFVYFSEYFYQGQAMRYYAFHRSGGDERLNFPLIQHEHNIDLLIEETGNRFPRSGDVWEADVEPKLAALREEPYGLKGMYKIFYPKLYAPLIPYDSLLCLFNHRESEIQFFNERGELRSRVPIQYHKNKKWQKEIVYDPEAQVAFTAFDTRWGEQLRQIYLDDGRLGTAIPVDLAFIENLKIRDGYLYFLHRDPYRGGRKRMLRKIRLK